MPGARWMRAKSWAQTRIVIECRYISIRLARVERVSECFGMLLSVKRPKLALPLHGTQLLAVLGTLRCIQLHPIFRHLPVTVIEPILEARACG